MKFQHINHDDHERMFITVQSAMGSMSAGMAVCFDVSTFDGVRVAAPATANLNLFAGICVAPFSQNEYGIAQCYGKAGSVLLDSTTGLGAGDPLKVTDGNAYLSLVTAGDEQGKGWLNPFVVAGVAYTNGATIPVGTVFIKAL